MRFSLAIEITVSGSPAPQGSKRHVGAGRMIESSKHVRPWRDAVRSDALLARERWTTLRGSWTPFDEPLAVEMVFTVPKPKSAPKQRRTWPMRLPDVSKLARSTEDALTDAGIWRDDARVVEYVRLAKVFPGEDPDALPAPGALIRIYQLSETATTCPLRASLRPEPPPAGGSGRTDPQNGPQRPPSRDTWATTGGI